MWYFIVEKLLTDDKGLKILALDEKIYKILMKHESSDDEARQLENSIASDNKSENGELNLFYILLLNSQITKCLNVC